MAQLELKNVYKNYKLANKEKFTALQDINISFEKGELVSIIGESGSGKSTLMNLIGGLDSDYDGIIKIDGKDLKDFKDKQLDDYRKKKIGFVFQSFNLIPHLSILDNVTIPLTLSNIKDTEKNQRAIELLTKLGLKDHIKKKPTQLSGGQKQRVAIARALINNPDIILADEPTGALDSETTIQILDILKKIADQEGKLVIMVTHSEKVASISSRIVEISDGKIIKDELSPTYKKLQSKKVLSQKENKDNSTKNIAKKKEKHLSFLNAIKLSFKNMWASKTKNILMAIGVSISLISLILMLSLGSGLTGYIDTLAKDYSNPNVVSISKSGKDRNGNDIEGSNNGILPLMFENDEINEITNDINNFLKTDKNNFQIETNGENKNISYGFMMPTMTSGVLSFQTTEGKDMKSPIYCTYTTPPYYTKENLVTDNSELCKENEILLSEAIVKLMKIDNKEDVIGKKVTLNIMFNTGETTIQLNKDVTISGIVDVAMFSSMLVMYIDYDFLNESIIEAQTNAGITASGIKPTQIYINTNSKKTTDSINSYLKQNRKDLSGSVEEKMASMFSEMMKTFSIGLAVIAGISLIVALIMILVVLYMSVSERTREIGVLKSIGARRKDIKLIFSTESLLIGVLSAITSIILSLCFGGILSLIFKATLGFAPIKMMWYYFIEAFAVSVVISVLAGLYPASKASKLDPVESLRHE